MVTVSARVREPEIGGREFGSVLVVVVELDCDIHQFAIVQVVFHVCKRDSET